MAVDKVSAGLIEEARMLAISKAAGVALPPFLDFLPLDREDLEVEDLEDEESLFFFFFFALGEAARVASGAGAALAALLFFGPPIAGKAQLGALGRSK